MSTTLVAPQAAPRTEAILEWVRRTDAFRQLVPPDAALGWPAIAGRYASVTLMMPLFLHRTRPGRPVELCPPFATLTVAWAPPRIAGYVDLRLAQGGTDDPERPVGTFPHAAIGDSESAYLALRRRLFLRSDEICEALAAGGEPGGDVVADFGRILRILLEPSLEPYYRKLAPGFFARHLAVERKADTAGSREASASGAVAGRRRPQTSEPPAPAHLGSERLAACMREARRAVERSASGAAAATLAALERQRTNPRAVVALVGSMKSGRSTLANVALGKVRLPSQAGASTSAVIRIVPSRDESLTLAAGGAVALRDVSEDAWLSLQSPDGGPGAATEAVLRVDADWLRRTDVELVDTPGLDTPGAPHAERSALEADLALMPVAALSPLDMRERAFLELAAARGLRVLLVLTQLDRVRQDERASVVDAVLGRSREHTAVCDVLVPAGLGGRPSTPELRGAVEAALRRDERRVQRARQAALGLQALCDDLMASAEEHEAAARLDAEERRRSLRVARARLDASRSSWVRLDTALQRRRTAYVQRVEPWLEERQAQIRRQLAYELSRAPDPQAWWTRDLPHRLRTELARAAQGVESSLQSTLDRDGRWLAVELARPDETAAAVAPGSWPVDLGAGSVDLPELELRSLERMRMLTRAGMAAGPVVAALQPALFPVGMVAGALAGIGGELLHRRAIGEQRDVVTVELEDVVDHAVGDLRRASVEAAFEAYDDVLERLRDWHQAWLQDHVHALAPQGGRTVEAARLRDEVARLRRQVESIAQPGDGDP